MTGRKSVARLTSGRTNAVTTNMQNDTANIDAAGTSHREINVKLREAVAAGATQIELNNVCGQRYIGTDLNKSVEIEIHGTPGNDLGAFMDGPMITVLGNAQDGCGNTMNSGRIVVHGHAGDTLGMSARGGSIFVKEYIGYRAGIHMKEFQDKKPVIVVGGTAQDFLGEYMAGGVLVILGLDLKKGEQYRAKYVGTGMHGGVIYLRGDIDPYQVGKEVGITDLDDKDVSTLGKLVTEFAGYFNCDADKIMDSKFVKLYPKYLRPYGRLYAY
jgi:glutamate synthase domain-containing protein 3